MTGSKFNRNILNDMSDIEQINKRVEEMGEPITFNMKIMTPGEEYSILLKNVKDKLEKRGIVYPHRTDLTDEEMLEYIINRWGGVLGRLAQIDE